VYRLYTALAEEELTGVSCVVVRVVLLLHHHLVVGVVAAALFRFHFRFGRRC